MSQSSRHRATSSKTRAAPCPWSAWLLVLGESCWRAKRPGVARRCAGHSLPICYFLCSQIKISCPDSRLFTLAQGYELEAGSRRRHRPTAEAPLRLCYGAQAHFGTSAKRARSSPVELGGVLSGVVQIGLHAPRWRAREPIVQHGPFVMSTQDQIMQAFQDYHSGNFLAEEHVQATRRARLL